MVGQSAIEYQKKVYEYWKQNHREWESGFKIFYGPFQPPYDIAILGQQPGGKPKSFDPYRERFEQGDFSPPAEPEYLTEDHWPIVKGMQRLFGEHTDLLGKSFKTNLNIFRAKDSDHWQTLPTEKREELEAYSHDLIKELLDICNPSLVIVEGVTTYDRVLNIWGKENQYEERRDSDNHRIFCSSRSGDSRVIGIMHPSGAHLSTDDENKIRQKIHSHIETETTLLP